MTYGAEVVYLFSGSDEKYMRDYNAQYLIQYEMLKFAARNHFEIYNFYGINGLPDENSKDYGIYEFKKGFEYLKLKDYKPTEVPARLFSELAKKDDAFSGIILNIHDDVKIISKQELII